MFKFQEILDSTIAQLVSESETENNKVNVIERLDGIIPEISDETADIFLDEIKKDAFGGNLESSRDESRQFELRLRELWREPIDLLELFIRLAYEAGYEFNNEYRIEAEESGDAVFEALIRLHARACQVSSAILVLLKSGFADDAHARWRSLHEMAVVSSFISAHGQEVAERYLRHEVIQQYSLAREYQKFRDRINAEPLSQEEFDKLESTRTELVCQFGKPFKDEYGWAADALGKKRPTLRAIEEQVNLDHWRPYYRMASDNVHANSHGANYRLGLHMTGTKDLLAGPSNAGLADPGHSTAISLNKITLSLLATRTNLDTIVVIKTLGMLVPEIGEAFLGAHHQYEAITLARGKPYSEGGSL